MKDFYSFDEYSIPYWIRLLYWGLYVAVFAFAAWKILSSAAKHKQLTDVAGWFCLFFALYAVFYCINSDYFRYRDWIYGRDFSFWGKERFYVYVIVFCRNLHFEYPFEVFRLIVWGGAVFIAYHTFRMYREWLLPGLTLLLLFVFQAGTFSYARASLAMAVYFLGIALFCTKKSTIPVPLCFLVAMSSYYFHREMLVGVVLLPCLFIPFERKNMISWSVLGLFLIIAVLTYASYNSAFWNLFFDNEEITSRLEEFAEQEQGAFRMSTFINYFKYFYPFYLITKSFWKRKIPHSVIGMYRITYGILMVSVAFMVVSGLRSVYTYRVLYISMIPLSLLMGYGYCNGHFTKKQLQIMIALALLSNSIRFINAQ